MRVSTYYHLTKPGLVRGNVFAGVAGFFLGSLGITVNVPLLCAMTLGLACVIASGCVLNNYFDREMDAKMERTKNRALPMGHVSERSAVLYGVVLGLLGGAVLVFFTTPLAFAAAFVGWFSYVWLYTPLKPRTPYALFVGAVAGAVPPVVGYTAVTNTFDVYAALLFVGLYLWQLPHFISIAVFRYHEYTAAGVPLFIQSAPSVLAQKRARVVFRASLVVLLVACLALIGARLLV